MPRCTTLQKYRLNNVVVTALSIPGSDELRSSWLLPAGSEKRQIVFLPKT